MTGRADHKARVLWVTDEPVDRALSGGSIRQSHLFEALARAFPTDLLIVGSAPDEHVTELAENVIELSTRPAPWTRNPVGRRALSLAISLASPYPLAVYPTYPARRALARELAARQHRYELICIEHESLAPLLPRSRSGRWLLTFHHLLSGMVESEASLSPGARQRWYRERDVRKARALERDAVSRFDRCIVCSDEDLGALEAICGERARERISVIPNGVDLSHFTPSPIPEEPHLLFPGNFAYAPNIDGAVWFCSEVWPRIRAAIPDASLTLAGRRPQPEVRALGRLPGVSVAADVPSMAMYFESARAIVVPLRMGTGTRLKALEAMAAGRPLVGTRVGLDGLAISDGEQARVADDPEQMATALIEVLRDRSAAERMGRCGRAHVEGRFEWERIGARLVGVAAELIGEVPAALSL
jgi:glycosyltransferase involved in cell wall biosynthesis